MVCLCVQLCGAKLYRAPYTCVCSWLICSWSAVPNPIPSAVICRLKTIEGMVNIQWFNSTAFKDQSNVIKLHSPGSLGCALCDTGACWKHLLQSWAHYGSCITCGVGTWMHVHNAMMSWELHSPKGSNLQNDAGAWVMRMHGLRTAHGTLISPMPGALKLTNIHGLL